MDRPFDKDKRNDDPLFATKLSGEIVDPKDNLDVKATDKKIIIKPKNTDSTLQTIMKYFRIGINKNKTATPSDVIRPLDANFRVENFTPAVNKYYKYWMEQCHDDVESFKNMVQVWQDMDMVFYNSSVISRAVGLIKDEVVQADLNMNCIGVEAEKKQKKFILDFFDDISLYKLIPSIAESVILYGNCGCVITEGEKGVSELIPIEIYDFKKVLSFTAYEVKMNMEKKDKFFIEYSSRERVNHLIQSILNEDNYASYFKEYIIGYQVSDFVLPPWKFLHFKNKTIRSPFKPWGCPLYIHAVAPYRQYDASMTLQVIARGMRFPVDKYSINAPNAVDPVSKLNIVTDFMRYYQNAGIGTTKKEEKGVGETVFTIKDLFDYEQITPNIDLGKIDDIDLLRDDLIIASQLPRSIIDEKDSGFGASGVALIQQWKPFARLVFNIQSIILENITQLVKIHMMLSGEFALDEMNFTLSMPYPESQISNEIVNNQKDLLDLTNNILDALSTRLLNGEPPPEELVRAVFHQIMPYDQKRIDDWIQIANDQKEKNERENKPAEPTEEDYNFTGKESNKNYKYQKLLTKLCEDRLLTIDGKVISNRVVLAEEIDKIIFTEKNKKLREGILKNQHFFSSKNNYEDFRVEQLREWEKSEVDDIDKQLLKEHYGINLSSETNEETKYVFDYKKEDDTDEENQE